MFEQRYQTVCQDTMEKLVGNGKYQVMPLLKQPTAFFSVARLLILPVRY